MIKSLLLLVASTPVFALATPQNEAQKPLQNGQPDIIHTLSLNSNLEYTIQTPFSHPSAGTSLAAIQDPRTFSTTYPTANLHIPSDASTTGTLTLTTSSHPFWQDKYTPAPPDNDDDILFFPLTSNRASHIPLHTLSLRRGGTLSMPVQAAAIDLQTPFITLPGSMWDVLVLATKPEEENMRVECERRGVFPELVLGTGDGEREGDIVVGPEQYVLEREGGCELLVRKGGDEEVEREEGEEGVVGLGWAAFRGRRFVVDLVGGKMGVGV
ncbi:hypothetical protein NX059_009805 [Plenodomus lindquistii]|nr:hypothetical protein NX059_009805 [Plenodomus lindquistii]